MNKVEELININNKYASESNYGTRKEILRFINNNSKEIPQEIKSFVLDNLGIPASEDYNDTFIDKFIKEEYSIFNKVLSTPQREVANFYIKGGKRAFVNAPTSFGKTLLALFLLKRMRYSKVAIIVPTIFLLTELSEKIKGAQEFEEWDVSSFPSERNQEFIIDILTPERFIESTANYDFVVYDEFYKVSDKYSVLDEKNDRRGHSFRRAFKKLRDSNSAFILLSPWLKIESKSNWYKRLGEKYNVKYFDYVLDNPITNTIINYQYFEDDDFNKTIVDSDGLTLIYCHSYNEIKKNAEILINSDLTDIPKNIYDEILELFHSGSSLRESKFGNFIKKGILIIGATLPKFLLMEIANFINKHPEHIRFILSTSTISEGINLPIKNIIINKLPKTATKFSLINLSGRSGRFSKVGETMEGNIYLNSKYKTLMENDDFFTLSDLEEGRDSETRDEELKKDKGDEAKIDKLIKEYGFGGSFENTKKKDIYRLIIRFNRLPRTTKKYIFNQLNNLNNINIQSKKEVIKKNLLILERVSTKIHFNRFDLKSSTKPKFVNYTSIISGGIYGYKINQLKILENINSLNTIRFNISPKLSILEKIVSHEFPRYNKTNFASYLNSFSTSKEQMLGNEYNLTKNALKKLDGDKKVKLKNEFETKYISIIEKDGKK